ncbi:bifunctional tRNA (5-methylaminomethyl-2-thiouridine)(34)-methyltransferase MnmD/FAD-dependent 5-carboxymethylaminomethyl-2-thiouridine(34) oxidoreductase MnmC [Kistimonas scapharcae]|uniref:tRNA 5-methylaminomethyl-2-thiouridine biosynthesis bifunctional protein MnmC n=1 Tax=Kistimonas scapharcae TaxID=1036133 RepID=A0ABP8VBE8_9GAMM
MPSTHKPVIETASIRWNERGQPVSDHYDDIYFSTESGPEETRHTFINQNFLPERFAALEPGQHFVVGETGFGTGLNFLCTWQCFDQHAPADTRLHFISTEKYPLTTADLAQALSLWPDLSAYSQPLVNHYPAMTAGQHRLVFDNGRIVLTLLCGDVLKTLPNLEASVDAWFLDGFAPAKNPDMWQPELFQSLAKKSASEATCATFTAARVVRDGLESAGFIIEKVPGFGRKRDMVRGRLTQAIPSNDSPVWFQQSKTMHNQKNALIIGAGMAGTATARSLAERGWQVRVIDSHDQPASEASGNPQGMLYTRLSGNSTVLTRFIMEGYLYTLSLLKRLEYQITADDTLWQNTGLIQLGFSESEQKRQQRILESGQYPEALLQGLDDEALSSLAGLPLSSSGLYFPDAGWVHPPSLCKHLLEHPNIEFIGNLQVTSIMHGGNQWHVQTTSGTTLSSEAIVVACGHLSSKLTQTQYLPLKSIRGQITQVPATKSSQKLQTVVCSDGYIAPAWNNSHTLGATFNFDDDSTECRQQDHDTNIENLKTYTPGISDALIDSELGKAQLNGRVSFRCTTPDYLPVVGPVVDADIFKEHFAPLRKNAKHRFTDTPEQPAGLYITTGHGSRGLVTAPLAAEILAGYICNEPSPVPRDQRHALHPSRFMIRDLVRNKA